MGIGVSQRSASLSMYRPSPVRVFSMPMMPVHIAGPVSCVSMSLTLSLDDAPAVGCLTDRCQMVSGVAHSRPADDERRSDRHSLPVRVLVRVPDSQIVV